MSTGGREFEGLKIIVNRLSTWISHMWDYHQGELKALGWRFLAIVSCTLVLTWVWNIGWSFGFTYHVLYTFEEMIAGPPGPVFVAPLGFLFGVIGIFFFDPYKRLQGLVLLGSGVVTLLFVARTFGRIGVSLTPRNIGVALVFFIIGLLFAGLDQFLEEGETELEDGFQRVIGLVGIFGLWGIIEATVDYQSPIVHRTPGEVVIGETRIPAVIRPLVIDGFGSDLETSAVAFVVYLLFLALLLYALWDFTRYELSRKILILGPKRSGKTWLMGGAGYCLEDRATDSEFPDPNINPPLNKVVKPFHDEDFNSDELEATRRGEFSFFSFTYEHGVVPRRRVKVQTVDYAGEHISDIITNGTHWDAFKDRWVDDVKKDGVNSKEVPDFETLVRLNEAQNQTQDPPITGEDIPSLLSVMITDASSVALILPADEFVITDDDHDDYDEPPEHIDDWNTVEDRLDQRGSNYYSADQDGYFQIYRDLTDPNDDTFDADFFYTVTMSDVFLKTFANDISSYSNPNGPGSWEAFREHVYRHISRDHLPTVFTAHPTGSTYKNFYPVYFEPRDPPGYTTDEGNFRPYLDWDDEYHEYPLRGLDQLLRRMGR